jgi:hypothetical protein
MNASKKNDVGQLNISWPVDETWTAHRRRDILESLDKLLKIRSVGLLADVVRTYSSSATGKIKKADTDEAISKNERRHLQRLAVQEAMGHTLDSAPVDQLVRIQLTEDKRNVNICLTFPVPAQVSKVYVTGNRVLLEDPLNRTLLEKISNKMIDGLFGFITRAGEKEHNEIDREVREMVDDDTSAILARHWSNTLGRQLTLDLALWARGEGIPGVGRISWDEPKQENKPKPELQNIYTVIDQTLSENNTNMAQSLNKLMQNKLDLVDRVIRSFGRIPQPLWKHFEAENGDTKTPSKTDKLRTPKM